MPSPVCFVCSDKERRKEVDALLRDGGESFESIAMIVGTSRWAIARHKRKHFEPLENALQGRHTSAKDKLYTRIEGLLAKAEKRRDWKMASSLVGRLAALRRGMEEPKPMHKPSE
jgi:hypothetical protein